MSIDCSSNSKLDTLNAKKAELESQVASLASTGSAGMAALKAKADEMMSALTDMIPSVPEIPNFQKEIQALAGKAGKELAEAKAAFKERWGDALPDIDIDDLMNKVSAPSLPNLNINVPNIPSFDLCKDVPNIDAPEIVNGKVTKVVNKGPEPTTPVESAKVVEEVTPTIVETEKQPTVSGLSIKARQELLDGYQAFEREVAKYVKAQGYDALMKEWAKSSNKIKKTRAYKKLKTKIAKQNIRESTFYNAQASSSEKDLIEKYWEGFDEAKKARAKKKRLLKVYNFWRFLRHLDDPNDGINEPADILGTRPVDIWSKSIYEGGKTTIARSSISAEDIKKIDADIKEIYEKYKEAIIGWLSYVNGKSEE